MAEVLELADALRPSKASAIFFKGFSPSLAIERDAPATCFNYFLVICFEPAMRKRKKNMLSWFCGVRCNSSNGHQSENREQRHKVVAYR